jgi:hypothetical protein
MKLKTGIVTSCLALALAGSAHAGGEWSTIEWFDDGDLSFITSTNVTHSADFVGPEGSAAEVNGFTFEAIGIDAGFGKFSIPYSGKNFTIDASAPPGGIITCDYSAGFDDDTASRALCTGLIAGGTITYTLDGLKKNTNYEFYFFSPPWRNDRRTGFLIANDDSKNAIEIDQTVGARNKIIKYAYNTGDSTSLTIAVTVSDTFETDGISLHSYAFVNIVP